MIQNIITNPRLLRELRIYSMLRARESEGSARRMWVQYAKADHKRMLNGKKK